MMMVATLLPIFFSFYLGSWCDIFGRKLLIKVYLISKVFGKTGLILCSYFMNSSKYWILLCVIPYGIAGLILIVCFSFFFLYIIFIILTIYQKACTCSCNNNPYFICTIYFLTYNFIFKFRWGRCVYFSNKCSYGRYYKT